MTLDVARLKKDFPTLAREVHGKRLVYLDSGATSQTPQAVIDAMDHYYEFSNSNVHRGVYQLAEEATNLYEGGRTKVAEFFGWTTEGTVFTKNVTEAINLVAYSWVRRRLGPGDALLTTMMEHHANLVPWIEASKDCGFELRHIPITDDGLLDLDAARALLADGQVQFLALTHVSNVLGTINDVSEVAQLARAANPDCKVLIDGAQAAPHLPVDVAALDVDFYAITGHKMLGPTGIGALLAKTELLDAMPPFLTGGEMIREVTPHDATWNDLPHKFEAGTPMIAESAGLGAAVDYLSDIGMPAIRDHEVELSTAALAALSGAEGVSVHGSTDPTIRAGVISFVVEGVHPHDLGAVLDREGVAVRVGHHCAKPLLKALNCNASARASFYLYNDADDIPPLIAGIAAARKFFLG